MKVYYNENDPYAAQWLRNLIAAGHIAAGDVDDRSIVDVTPDDVRGYDQAHFFAGVGLWSLALRLAGADDLRCWTGSCPCQPFSSAGKQKGAKDERHLWPELRRLVTECRPAIIFGEQVASALGRMWLGGKSGLQRLQDRETVVRILQERNLLDGLPDAMQDLLQVRRSDSQSTYAEGEAFSRLQAMASTESGFGVGADSGVSRQVKRSALHTGSPSRSNDYRCGDVSDDGYSVQSGRGPDVGQPVVGPDRQYAGLHANERARGAVRRECDGEHLGREQNRRSRAGDHASAPPELSSFTEPPRIRTETATEFKQLAGVRTDLEALGYAVGAADLCAASVGAPHIRQRLFWSAVCLADAAEQGRCSQSQRTSIADRRSSEESGRLRRTSGLADARRAGDERGRRSAAAHGAAGDAQGEAQQWQRSGTDAGHCGAASGLADDDDGQGRSQRPQRDGQSHTGFDASFRDDIGRRRGHVGLGDADDERSQGRRDGSGEGRSADQRTAGAAGISDWSDCILIPCSDGKTRRAQSSIQPLAHAGEWGTGSRVGILRGAGNAIVAPLAATFIKACLPSFNQERTSTRT